MKSPNQPQKVLIAITKTDFGGAQRYAFEVATALKEQGCEVAVAGGGAGNLLDKLKAAEIKTFTIEGAQRDLSLAAEYKSLVSLWRIVRDYKPEVIHLNSSKIGVLGSVVARLLRVPRIIFTAHGWPYLENRPLWWRAIAWSGSYLTTILAHQVILVSQNDLRNTNMPLVRNKLTVIHTATSDFTTLTRDEARLALYEEETVRAHEQHIWLGTIGELNRNKNHQTVIDAIAEFNYTNQVKIFFTVISDGELRNLLEEQIELKGLKDYVQLVGHKAEARQYLNAFDIFILPSIKEGLPYALLEAGKCGLPCIASFVGGIPEVITNLESGLLIDPNNHMSIVKALTYYLDNPNARIAYGEALRQHIEEKFNNEHMMRATNETYWNQTQQK